MGTRSARRNAFFVSFACILAMACASCDARSPEERAREQFEAAERTPQGIVAVGFARLLVAGEFEEAASWLDPALLETTTPASLAAEYAKMIAYGAGPADQVQAITFLDDWADRRSDDLGWAYVAISGPLFDEAIAVVVTKSGRIRSIEWGRP